MERVDWRLVVLGDVIVALLSIEFGDFNLCDRAIKHATAVLDAVRYERVVKSYKVKLKIKVPASNERLWK